MVVTEEVEELEKFELEEEYVEELPVGVDWVVDPGVVWGLEFGIPPGKFVEEWRAGL